MSKKRSTVAVAFLVLGVVVLGLAVAVYAKYVSNISKTGTATVAKWSFTSDNQTGTVACELDQTYDTDTLAAGRIAPGTSGKCPITVSNANTEVGIRYDIKPSTVANQPAHLKFYSDAAHQNEITATGSATVTGTLEPGATSSGVYVYWLWPYEDDPSTVAYDEIDTTDGEGGATMTMTFDVTGTQIQPAAQ